MKSMAVQDPYLDLYLQPTLGSVLMIPPLVMMKFLVAGDYKPISGLDRIGGDSHFAA
jgi:hypothetical protein